MDGQVFQKETVNLMVKAGDDALKLPFWAEPFDGTAIKILINFVNKQADKVVPDSVDPLMNSGVKKALAGDLDGGAADVGSALNVIIDIPLLDEESEEVMFVDGVKFIVRLIKNWIEGLKAKKAEKEEGE